MLPAFLKGEIEAAGWMNWGLAHKRKSEDVVNVKNRLQGAVVYHENNVQSQNL